VNGDRLCLSFRLTADAAAAQCLRGVKPLDTVRVRKLNTRLSRATATGSVAASAASSNVLKTPVSAAAVAAAARPEFDLAFTASCTDGEWTAFVNVFGEPMIQPEQCYTLALTFADGSVRRGTLKVLERA
jgi:hypothetical protein